MSVPSLVLVGGAARSGTTVLARTLAEHSDAAVPPELYFLGPLIHSVETGSVAGFVRSRFGRRRLDSVGVQIPESLQTPQTDRARQAVEIWVQVCEQLGVADSPFVIEHSPSNTVNASFLAERLPVHGVVHTVRDGRAVLNSIRRADFGPQHPTVVAQWWMAMIAAGQATERSLVSTRVRYEDLLRDPAGTADEALDALAVPTIDQRSVPVPHSTISRTTHALLDADASPARADAWRDELDPAIVATFESMAGPVLRDLGYDCPAGVLHGGHADTMALADALTRLTTKAPRRLLRFVRASRALS
ncbi:MAG: sulfotransferase [Acidimicrobiales bacterium]